MRNGHNGLLRGFFDVEGFVDTAIDILRHPGAYHDLGRAPEQTIADTCSPEAVMPAMVAFYEGTAAGAPPSG